MTISRRPGWRRKTPTRPLLAGLSRRNRAIWPARTASQEAAARLSTCYLAPHLLLGGLYFQQDDYPQAAVAYEGSRAWIQPTPTRGTCWAACATSRMTVGAAEAAQQAVALEPDMVEAQRLLALARFDLGDAAGALPAAQA